MTESQAVYELRIMKDKRIEDIRDGKVFSSLNNDSQIEAINMAIEAIREMSRTCPECGRR